MTSKGFLTCALLALAAAFPASAAAQQPVPPPTGDNYLRPFPLNNTSQVFPYNDPLGFTADTTNYTTQADLFNPQADGSPNTGSPGPREITQCGSSQFGNTIWSVFYAHHWGTMHIEAAGGFDSVIAVVPFRGLNDAAPLYQFATCADRLFGATEKDSEIVFPGSWWAVSVGGTGDPQGGRLQETYTLKKPTQVSAQAFLFWDHFGARVTRMYAKKVTKGATLTLTCSKHACKKRKVTVKGKAALSKLFTSAGLVPVDSGSARMKGVAPGAAGGSLQAKRLARAAATDPTATAAAKTYKLLHNKKVKRGARIELRVTAFGRIGKYYRWNVGRKSISSPIVRCMNPDSSKPRKRCHG